MYVTVVVVAAALIAAAGVWVSARRPGGPDPLDPEAEERWLVRRLIGHPRLGPTALRIHRRSIGGLMLVAALAVTFASALVVGVLFDMVDRNRGLARWDRAVAEWGARNATARSTDVLNVLTNLGASAYLVVIGAVVALGDYIRRRNADVAAFLFTVLAGVLVINNGLKWIVDRDRPDVEHLAGASGSSFPSGHSAAAAAAWCALALVATRRSPRRARAAAAAAATMAALAVAASRALLGVHWLTDVIAGLIVGWGWFFLTAIAFGGRLQRLGDPAARAATGSAAPTPEIPPP